MRITIKPYTQNDIDAVSKFNRHLTASCVSSQFPESNIPKWLPKIDNREIYQEYFLAWEGDSVRGGYILKHQKFSFNGKIISIADYQQPLSEGIIDKNYNFVGIQLLIDALKRQPLLLAMGMGGYSEPLPKMLKALHWKMYSVPFYFKVIRPFNFLREITFLRKSKFRRVLMDLLAITGIGWICIKLFQALLKKKDSEKNSISVEIVNEFSHWADELWDSSKSVYSMMAVRDSATLNILYPSNSKRFIRFKVVQDGEVIGWAVVLNTKMSNHKQFGNMRVGSIIDCLALPENASKVIESASDYLEKAGVDLIVSNQSHSSWCLALKNAGFIKGPSNFIFAASMELSKLLEPFEDNITKTFINRGDGDGPIHL